MSFSYDISTTWDSQPIDHNPIRITVGPTDDAGNVILTASGPFFNDPAVPPNSTVGQPYMGLWDYEGLF